MRQIRRRLAFAVTAVLLVLTGGCGPGTPEQITLTLATFGQFGYDDLIPGYEFTHPGLTINQVRTEQGGPYHQDLLAKLRTGQGLADVQAVEEGHLSDVMAQSAKFSDLAEIGPADVKPGRWLEWKYEAGRSKDGKLVGYGTDIGPLAMCYRKDLLEAAGLPTDPGSVKTMFATWDSYFQAGARYVKRSKGKAWFDSAAQNFNAMRRTPRSGAPGTRSPPPSRRSSRAGSPPSPPTATTACASARSRRRSVPRGCSASSSSRPGSATRASGRSPTPSRTAAATGAART
jgi:cellobiose transport system substrate-binding protein